MSHRGWPIRERKFGKIPHFTFPGKIGAQVLSSVRQGKVREGKGRSQAGLVGRPKKCGSFNVVQVMIKGHIFKIMCPVL
jgi:hypothetical protein